MELRFEQVISHPLENVYSTMRDRLAELVPHLVGVESILVQEREQLAPGRVRMLNLWQASPEAAPKAVRPFVSRKMLSWKDHAEWNDADHTVRWRFETSSFEKLFECQGSNRFEDLGGFARLRIEGELHIFLERLPGVPKFLAKRIAPKVEAFIGKIVGDNLRGLAGGLQAFLDGGA